ncbi:MAG: glycosyltransferase family 4 protein [Bacteroidota bacterium]
MPIPTVLFAHLGDVTGSSRALRQIRELDAMGVGVEVVQVGPPRRPEAIPARTTLTVLPRPTGRGPAFFWAAHRAVTEAVGGRSADLYLASDLYVLPALARAARRHRGRLVYDSRELYAALDASAGRPLVSAVWRAVEGRHIRKADAVLTVSDRIADRLGASYDIARPTVLYNAPAPHPEATTPEATDSERTGPEALRRALRLPDDGRLVVLYQGLFRAGRGLPALVEAVGVVEGIRLVLIGEGDLEPKIRRLGDGLGGRLVVHPFVPPDALAALTPGADLGACLIEPLTESLRLSLPNKLFEYLSAGVPVLASPLPEIRRVVQGAGILADPQSPEAVEGALRTALDANTRATWAAHSRDALAPYAWTTGRETFRRLILDLLPA